MPRTEHRRAYFATWYAANRERRGKNVCGLHVAANLQLLLADENRSKSNALREAA